MSSMSENFSLEWEWRGQFKRRHYSALKITRKETVSSTTADGRNVRGLSEGMRGKSTTWVKKGGLKMKYTQYTKCFQKSLNKSKCLMKTSIKG